MNCAECKELLVGFLEGLIDEAEKEKITEHIKSCANCTAELEKLEKLHKSLINNGEALGQSDLEIEVFNRIIREQREKLKTAGHAGQTINFWKLIMKSPIIKLAAAAAIIIIAGMVWLQYLSGTSAYAQVVAELKKAHTVVFTIITQANTGNGDTIKVDVAYKEPGHLRTTTVDGYIAIIDMNSGKMISIVPQGGYTLGNIDKIGTTDAQDPFISFKDMENLPAEADENLGAKDIDGFDTEGFRVTQGDLTTDVWIDVKTGDLVQVEQKYASAPGMDKIIKNIKFNIELEDSLFSLTPPAGFKEFGGEMKSVPALQTEETFIAWLRWWANGNVDETFPPMVAGSEIAKVVMDMGREGKLKGDVWKNADVGQMFNALLFVTHLPKESNWRYAGDGVKLGTADKAIFWYKPAGSDKYRVIYGDLSVQEVAPEDLPN